MKIWIERNITSSNHKKFLLVDITQVLSEKRFRIREENGNKTIEVIGCLNKGPIIDSISNRVILNEIRLFQDNISAELERVRICENMLERITLEEIINDPNF